MPALLEPIHYLTAQVSIKTSLACRNAQNSAANYVFFVSVSRYTSSKYAIFATNFDHFSTALDSG
jgi:hypothetical protein